ncbi:hypothetical protein [Peribacillus simplex]|uniref:Uncharacterized protein n=1 Tax=Peribacillus simplex TaxID=1478 RepID=A0A9W4KUK5_9BACI|nr:hypothetical protein [Peribacillus simplex]MDR4924888.1 hypothetical protein [Peribacillus simplex]WHX90394.1 hypothetical protein QNH50_20625 [Peribacillus simplex]CAH0155587.1 hypothetical protein SRABI133_00819 [Peribacillus simplex]
MPFENQRDYPLFVHLDLSQTKKRNKTAHIGKDFVTGVWDFVINSWGNKAATVKGVTKAKELVSIPNLLPYNPNNELFLAGGVLNAKRGINKFY